ncbi:MAG: S-adenosylmethionine:tRNA ribosyltransferase-isomerase [Bacteroidetes bacterium]|nr:S-adenosylmethionine:tRNA ribosyltransferase-isomerase [Bacteroidota bacterium]
MALPPGIHIAQYNYDLPADRIAQRPLVRRDASRLLVYRDGLITDGQFSEIDKLVPEGSLMVFNDTKVVRARLVFAKPTGGLIEIFCLEPLSPTVDFQLAFQQGPGCRWSCLVGNAKKWKDEHLVINLDVKDGWLKAVRKSSLSDGCFEIEFSWAPASLSFSDVLLMAGRVPLPPYINRDSDDEDTLRYQTVYAKHEGSVAAPTAGLHFSEDILERLRTRNCAAEQLTLHVGLGTFRPVSVTNVLDHIMHNESFVVRLSTLRSLCNPLNSHVIAVGTTSARTLESLYWLGVKVITHPQTEINTINQWDPYQTENSGLPGKTEALAALIKFMEDAGLKEFHGSTSLIIVPGYQFRVLTGLITNFHMPRSTLLLLIAAFAGDGWKTVYSHALAEGYRFLSYGDACMFL